MSVLMLHGSCVLRIYRPVAVRLDKVERKRKEILPFLSLRDAEWRVCGWAMRNFPLAEGRGDGRMVELQGEKTSMHVCVCACAVSV